MSLSIHGSWVGNLTGPRETQGFALSNRAGGDVTYRNRKIRKNRLGMETKIQILFWVTFDVVVELKCE